MTDKWIFSSPTLNAEFVPETFSVSYEGGPTIVLTEQSTREFIRLLEAGGRLIPGCKPTNDYQQAICRLRDAIGPLGGFIETKRGRGYCFNSRQVAVTPIDLAASPRPAGTQGAGTDQTPAHSNGHAPRSPPLAHPEGTLMGPLQILKERSLQARSRIAQRLHARRTRDRDEQARLRRALARERSRARIVAGAAAMAVCLVSFLLLSAGWRAPPPPSAQLDDGFWQDVLWRNDPMGTGLFPRPVYDRGTLESMEAQIRRQYADPVGLARELLALSGTYFSQNDYAEASRLQNESINLLSRALGAGSEKALIARYMHVRSLGMLRQHEAAALLAETDGLAGGRLRHKTLLTLLSRSTCGSLAQTRGDVDRMRICFEEAESIRQEVAPGDPTWMYWIRSSLAWVYVRKERSQYVLEITEMLTRQPYIASRLQMTDWARLHAQRGLALRNLGRFEEAIREFEDVKVQARDSAPFVTTAALYMQASTYQAQGRLQEAQRHYRLAEARLVHHLGAYRDARLELRMAEVFVDYLASGHADLVLPQLRQVRADLADALGDSAPMTQLADYYLATVLCEAGMITEALQHVQHLDPWTLAIADASEHWQERLQALHGQMLMAAGNLKQGQQCFKQAVDSVRLHDRSRLVHFLEQRRERAEVIAKHGTGRPSPAALVAPCHPGIAT